ncbi:NADH dehydrogenase 1 alpha subcomplex subunit 12 [Citrus sinensis]|uniref:NADH dehydrogenase 1 alpha subcomplex subunit 12 n=1 Tax=Citrus sinensis TaxID=2711 RepID=A0ACB8P050_CITSI|nr:NADH dehydrogenase 1 alpha subcomplex subunit 12 [Citrus sinensis]KAH9803761.1 NADH dehydrogenase 1 alpha subcomplex subunit 12 [Citrus sinensis]
MSRLLARIAGFFSSRTQVGVDKAGNRYFTRTEELDGRMKEKRWVVFKGEQDPTSVPVEWICWLNGQRKIAPTPEEIAELEARRERVKLNVALLKKEEKEKRAKEGTIPKRTSSGIVGGPDLKSFLRQFPSGSEGDKRQEPTGAKDGERGCPLPSRHLILALTSCNISAGPRKQRQRKQNQCQSIRSQQDLANPSGQGRGNHQHDNCDTATDSTDTILSPSP